MSFIKCYFISGLSLSLYLGFSANSFSGVSKISKISKISRVTDNINNNILITDPCVTNKNTFYEYNFDYFPDNGDLESFSVSFLYNAISKNISPSKLSKDKKSKHFVIGSNNIKNSICIDALNLKNKQTLKKTSSLKNSTHMVSIGCSTNSIYSFSNDMSSISCFNKKTKKVGDVYYDGEIFLDSKTSGSAMPYVSHKNSPHKKTIYKTATCKKGRFFKIGNENLEPIYTVYKIGGDTLAPTYSEEGVNWSSWICVNGKDIKPATRRSYEDKNHLSFQCNSESVLIFKRKNSDLADDDTGHYGQFCMNYDSKNKSTVTVGCDTSQEKGHTFYWQDMTCGDQKWNMLVSSVNGRKLKHPIGYASLRCLGGGKWVNLDKKFNNKNNKNNKKTRDYKFNKVTWQRWGCVKAEGILDKVKRVL